MDESRIIELYENGMSLRKIESIYGIPRKRSSKILKSNNITIRTTEITSRKYDCEHQYFEDIDSPDKAYWLGFIAADGFIESKRKNGAQKLGITLSATDLHHLELFNKAILSTYEIKTYVGSGYNRNGEFVRLLITSQKMVDDLKKYGIIEGKTNVLKFPTNINEKYYNDFIRGYFDGNGSIYFQNNGQFGMSICGSEDILSKIKQYYNITSNVRDTKKGTFELSLNSSKNAYSVLKNMYYENHPISLKRKYEKFSDLRNILKDRV